MRSPTDFVEFAVRVAAAAGDAILPHFRETIAVEDKGGVARLRSGHGGRSRGGSGDPRGDRARVSRSRHPRRGARPRAGDVAVHVGHRSDRRHAELHPRAAALGDADRAARRRRGRSLGVAHQPFVGETFVGMIGDVARMAARRRAPHAAHAALRATSRTRSSSPPIRATSPTRASVPRTQAVTDGARLIRYGGDCYCYTQLAMGLVDIVIETGLQPYDVQALIPLDRSGRRRDHQLAGRTLRRGRRRAGLRRSGAARRAARDASPRREAAAARAARAFSGRHVVDAALARGHDVTLFTRGRNCRRPGPPRRRAHRRSRSARRRRTRRARTRRHGTRPSTRSGYVPRVVAASAELLASRVARYLFVSSVSVYADTSRPGIDEARAGRDARRSGDRGQCWSTTARSRPRARRVVTARFGARATHVRPGLIVGPFDGDRPLRLLGRALRASGLLGERPARAVVPGAARARRCS